MKKTLAKKAPKKAPKKTSKKAVKKAVKKYVKKYVDNSGTPLDQKCCYGHGLWAIGDPAPMGPMDAADGYPTKRCPVCGANKNPQK